jgi:hypothetical protein
MNSTIDTEKSKELEVNFFSAKNSIRLLAGVL